MPIVTLFAGLLLVTLGLVGYFTTGAQHVTALIPTWFGVAFIVLGLWATSPKWRMHSMHIVILVALVGFFGTIMGIVHLLRGDVVGVAHTAAVAKSIMSVICLVFIVICIRSFVAARARRRRGANSQTPFEVRHP